MATTTIGVEGMTCGGCVNSVTKAVQRVSGVQEVNVSLEAHQATIQYDENVTNVAALKEAIEDAGYDTN